MLNKENIKDIYKLSPMQEGMFFHALKENAPEVYLMQLSFELVGELDLKVFQEAWDILFKRHDILRTVFVYKNVKLPLQVVLKQVQSVFDFIDLVDLDSGAQAIQLDKLKASDKARGFKLSEERLMRMMIVKCSVEKYVVVWSYHHIILDGWSMGIILHEFLDNYYRLKQGDSLTAIPSIQYKDYIKWLEKRDKASSLKFWKTYLNGFEIPTSIPRKNTYHKDLSTKYRKKLFSFEKSITQQLTSIAKKHQTTLGAILQIIWGLILQKFNDADDIVFGTVVSGRPAELAGVDSIPGLFINALPFRLQINRQNTVLELFAMVKKNNIRWLLNQHAPLFELQSQLGVKTPLFDHIVLVNNYPLNLEMAAEKDFGFTIADVSSFEQTHYPLTIIIMPFDEILFDVSYDANMYSSKVMNSLEEAFRKITLQIVHDINQPICEIAAFPSERKIAPYDENKFQQDDKVFESLSSSELSDVLFGKNDRDVVCIQNQETVFQNDLLKLVTSMEQLIRGRRDDEKITAVCCSCQSTKYFLVSLLLAEIFDVQLRFFPRHSEDCVSEAVHFGWSDVVITDVEQPSLKQYCEINGKDFKLYLMESAEIKVDDPLLIYNTSRVGYPVYSGLDFNSFFATARSIGESLSLNENAKILVVIDSLEDLEIAFIFAGLLCHAKLVIINATHKDYVKTISELQFSHVFFAAIDKNILRDLGRKCGDATVVFHRNSVHLNSIQNLPGEFLAAYTFYGTFAEGFYLNKLTDKTDVALLGHAVGDSCSFIIDRFFNALPVGAKGRIFFGNKNVRMFTLNHDKLKSSWAFAHPSFLAERLYNSSLNGCLDERCNLEISSGNVLFYDRKKIIHEDLEQNLIQKFNFMACKVFTVFSKKKMPLVIVYYVSQTDISYVSIRSYVEQVMEKTAENICLVEIPFMPLKNNGDYDFKPLKDLLNIFVFLNDSEHAKSSHHDISMVLLEKLANKHQAQEDCSNILTPMVTCHWTSRNITKENFPKDALLQGSTNPYFPCEAQTLIDAFKSAAETDGEIVFYNAHGKVNTLSYSELFRKSCIVLQELKTCGLKPKDKVIIIVQSNLLDYFGVLWACILGGIIPLTISSKALTKLNYLVALLSPSLIIAADDVCEEISAALKLESEEKHNIVSFTALDITCEACDKFYNAAPHEVVILQLSSGSTHVPKCIPLTHGNIFSHIFSERCINNYEDDERTLNWLPFEHVVPLINHIRDVVLDYVQIQVEHAFILNDILNWLRLMENCQVTRTWAPNFAFRLLSDSLKTNTRQHWKLQKLKSMMNAGEQISWHTISELEDMFANFDIKTHVIQPAYGLAESTTCITYVNQQQDILVRNIGLKEHDADQDSFQQTSVVAVGTPVPFVSIGIFNQGGKLVHENIIGEIRIKGPMVLNEYFPETKGGGAIIKDGWLATGDLGFVSSNNLFVVGRIKESIIINGVHYSCYEIEEFLNCSGQVCVGCVAVLGVMNQSTGAEFMAVFFVPPENDSDNAGDLCAVIKSSVTKKFGVVPEYVIPVDWHEFPKTEAGKIKRTELVNQLCSGTWNALLNQDVVFPPVSYHRFDWAPKKLNKQYHKAQERHYLLLYDRKEDAVCELGGMLCACGINAFLVEKNAQSLLDFFEGLTQKNIKIDVVISTIGYSDNEKHISTPEILASTLESIITDLYSLIKNLDAYDQIPAELYLIASNSQKTSSEASQIVDVAKGLVSGLIRTLRQELVDSKVYSIDFSDNDKVAEQKTDVLNELIYNLSDSEVMYRSGVRFVPGIKKIRPLLHDDSIAIKENGFYVVTGGFGQIGWDCVKFLTEKYHAKVLVVGRRDCKEIRRHLKNRFNDDVVYARIDITDLAGLRYKIDELKAKWQCELDGFFHLANVYHHDLFVKGCDLQIIQGMINAKIIGALNVHQILNSQKNRSLFVSFSSVNSYFGGIEAGLYSGMNSALNALMSDLSHSNPSYHIKNICWSKWSGEVASNNQWFINLSNSRAFIALETALKLNEHEIIVGLNEKHSRIAAYNASQNLQEKKLILRGDTQYLEKAVGLLPTPIKKEVNKNDWEIFIINNHERVEVFGKNKRIDLLQEIDKPRDELEVQVKQLWEEVLEVENISIHDDFFDLGGHSIKLLQLHSKLLKLRDDISFSFLQKYSTIAKFSEHVLHQPKLFFSDSIIVPLNKKNNSANNLFMLHPAVGEVISYQKIGHHLEGKVNLYGIQAKGLFDSKVSLDHSVEEIAKSYVDQIIKVQPHGVYYICAYSLSVHVGYEIVRLMEQKGLVVKRYLIIDNSPHEKPKTISAIEEKLDFLLCEVLKKVLNIPAQSDVAIMNEVRLESTFNQYADENGLISHMPKSYFFRFLEVVRNLYLSVLKYTVKGTVNADFVYLLTEKYRKISNGESWRQFTTGVYEVDYLEGTHTSILDDPCVKKMTDKILEYLS